MSDQQNFTTHQYDVVVVGAGLAGCAAARLYAENGLKVALLERRPHIKDYKKSCTHYIQASALPTMQRLGLAEQIEKAGGLRNSIDTWTQWGWIRHEVDARYPKYGYSIRREVLDPIMRELAVETEGVDLLLGHSVKALQRNAERITGVVAQNGRSNMVFEAKLVVGADGYQSTVAKLADIPLKERDNNRFIYWAYYKNVPASGKTAQMWLVDPDVVYHFPSDNGITLLAVIITKDKLTAFKEDIVANFESLIAQMPDAPRFDVGERITDVMGMINYPNFERQTWVPGLALIGDAAVTSDPIWGVGCGWAMQSAEWLVDCTSEALLAEQDLKRSLKQYNRKHSFIRTHNSVIADYSSGRMLNGLEALYFKAGTLDRRMARLSHNLGSRHINPIELFFPTNLIRAMWVTFKHRKKPVEQYQLNFQPMSATVQK